MQREANVFVVTYSIFMAIRALYSYYLLISFSVSEVAPYLRGSGARQQVVLEGNRLVLTCMVGGSWPLQYRWTLNNSNVTDWTPQYRLVLTHSCRIFLHPSAVGHSTPDHHLEGSPSQVCYLQVFPALLVLTLLDSIQSLLTKLPQCQSLGALEPKRDLFGSHFFPSPLSELSGSSERRCEGGQAADCHCLISCTL